MQFQPVLLLLAAIVIVAIAKKAMADSESVSFAGSRRQSCHYTRDSLLQLNADLPPCPTLEPWVPVNLPLDHQHQPQQRDGSGLHSDNNTGAGLPSVNNSCSNNNHRRSKDSI